MCVLFQILSVGGGRGFEPRGGCEEAGGACGCELLASRQASEEKYPSITLRPGQGSASGQAASSAWTPAAARRRAEAEAGQYFVTTP